jgi:dihydrodipicolinate synthase/N-acetylneuraminate lyase
VSTRREVHGVLPVLSTPFNAEDEIDREILEREIEWVLSLGADGVTTGMVSEILRLSPSERMYLHEIVGERTKALGGIVVLSAGGDTTRQAIEYAKHAESCNADAIMVNPPISTSLNDEETFRHYCLILDSTEIPLIVQDASGYVGQPLSLSVQVELLTEYGKRVYFKPEAVPIGPRLSLFLEATDGKARVLEGSGGAALVDTFQRGIVGTMPGADTTWILVALWRALKADDWDAINMISGPLASLLHMEHSLDAYLAVEKYLLVKQNVFKNEFVRGPVGYRLDSQSRSEVDRLFDLLYTRIFNQTFIMERESGKLWA